MHLVIVESPTKSKTIQKFLGKDYKVLASFGHVRDLPKSDLGIDVENDFQPKYIIPTKAKKNLTQLKKEVAQADDVILSTDPDREGEAIAWHLKEALKLDKKPYQRIAFHEITKSAIEDALAHPRDIDLDLVNSQQARRILDRLVGYKLSPLLWKKISKGLSAGRVQSVAMRLICDREDEIKKFIAQEYWSITALLAQKNQTTEFEANLLKKDGKDLDKLEIKSEKEAQDILDTLNSAPYIVEKVERKEIKRQPQPPFSTSTLQQEASNKLHFSSKMTMVLAQQLYEMGLITYHRTDSFNLSDQSINDARQFIAKNFGENYLPAEARRFQTKSKSAQEAHEAIRPSYSDNTPENIKAKLDEKQAKLYGLIWRRFMACQAKEAVFDAVRADISAKNFTFRANGQTLKFDGFLKINPTKFKEKELPKLVAKEELDLHKIDKQQHFTEPPPRFTEATLIKALEEDGIGRPSTYASIISTILFRNYVQKNKSRQLEPTEIGLMVNKLLVEHFPAIVDLQFTARMEDNLDDVADKKLDWVDLLRQFYIPFKETLDIKYKEIKKENTDQPTDKTCPDCKAPVIIKTGRFGKFYACSAFPECKYTAPMETPSLDVKCPKCKEGDMKVRKTKRGKIFYSCSRWPDCDFALWDKPINEFCPQCKNILVETNKGQVKCSNKECDYKKPNEAGGPDSGTKEE